MSLTTARGVRRSPFHERLAGAGAYFKEVSGWESPDWYAGAGATPDPGPLSWGRPSWFPRWRDEHRAAREDVIVMDMSFMGKFLVQGRDAGRSLNRLSGNQVDGAAGIITYTQWLNEGGTLEADLTVTKLADERFLVVVTDTMVRHAETWMKRNIPDDAHAVVTDVTSAYGQLNVQGPNSRALLQKLTSVDLSNGAFPFRAAREIDIGFARALCIRITYVGELGYELYVPAEQAVHVYDRIVEAGREFGLVHAGLKALGSLRMEKGYRDYGHDIDNTDGPYEAGLGFALDLNKPDGFIGKEAVLAGKARGPLTRRLRAGAGQGPRAAHVPRRGRASRRHRGGLRARGVLRPHARWRGGPGHDRAARAGGRGLPGRGPLGSRHRRAPLSGGGVGAAAVRSADAAHPHLAVVGRRRAGTRVPSV